MTRETLRDDSETRLHWKKNPSFAKRKNRTSICNVSRTLETVFQMVETPSYTLAATPNALLLNGASKVYDSVLYPLQPLESGLEIDIVSHGHGQKCEMFCLANFTCTMKISFKNWVTYRMLSSSKWRTTTKDLIFPHWEKHDVFTENRRDPNWPWLISSGHGEYIVFFLVGKHPVFDCRTPFWRGQHSAYNPVLEVYFYHTREVC